MSHTTGDFAKKWNDHEIKVSLVSLSPNETSMKMYYSLKSNWNAKWNPYDIFMHVLYSTVNTQWKNFIALLHDNSLHIHSIRVFIVVSLVFKRVNIFILVSLGDRLTPMKKFTFHDLFIGSISNSVSDGCLPIT